MTEFGQIRRRPFVAIATAEYEDRESFPDLPVSEEVKIVRGWLTDEKLADRRFRHVHRALARNPAKDQIRKAFEDPPRRDQWRWGDAAVVYITGHGFLDDKGENSPEQLRYEHYLALKETGRKKPYQTGLATVDLFKWLFETEVEYLLVIIDACFAGQVTEQVKALARDHWLILPAAGRRQTAELGALAMAIREYLESAREFNRYDPYLKVGMFVAALNDQLPWDQKIEQIYKGKGKPHDRGYRPESDPHVCLPNPNYQPQDELVETVPARQALALPRDLLELHQRTGSRPPSADAPAGWLFTGRKKLMRELIRAVGKPRVTMVTGSAGSGKSTMLSRLVTLSDPVFQEGYADYLDVPAEMLPPLESVDVAISARGLSNWQVVGQICHDLGEEVTAGNWVEQVKAYRDTLSGYLARRQEPTTIVIDALDEAQDAAGLVRDVLGPLRREHPGRLCLLIGVRSPGRDDVAAGAADLDSELLPGLVAAELQARRVQVDDDSRWSRRDLMTYTRNILRNTENSPYRDASGAAVTSAAEVICAFAGRSYLLAGVAAGSAAERHAVIAPDDPGWLDALGGGLLGVFRKDLEDSFPSAAKRRRAVMLLRAVAFARGNGLPWRRVWPRMANAVDADEEDYGRGEIEWLLRSRLSAYLVTGQQDDLTVYRLMHDQVRQTLRYRWRELLDRTATQQADEAEVRAVEARIARKLRDLAKVPPTVGVDQGPSPYVRRHLVEHALAGGILDESLVPVPFLPYLDLAHLRSTLGAYPALRQSGRDLSWLPVVRQITHLWDWTRPARNAAAIEMWSALTRTRLRGQPEDPGPVGGPWRVRWALRPSDTSSVLGEHADIVRAAATASLPDAPVAVTGGMGGELHIWDLSRGTPYRDLEPIDTQGGAVRAVTTARLPGAKTVVITGGEDGLVRIWDPRSGRALGAPLGGAGSPIESVTAAALPGRRAVIAAADRSGTVRVWDLVSRVPVGVPVSCGPGLALGLATAVLGEQVLGLATGRDGGLQIWDLATGIPVCGRLTSHPRMVRPGTGTPPGGRAIAAVVLGQREVAITGNDDGLLLWDLRDRRPADRRLKGSDGTIRSLSAAVLDDRVMAVTGGNRAVQVWDLTVGQPAGGLLTGHSGSVDAVAVVRLADGTALAVSGSPDKTVRSWEVPGGALSSAGPLTRQAETVQAVATARLPRGQAIAITCSRTEVQVRDLANGGEPELLTGHDSPVRSVAAAGLPDGTGVLIAATGWDGSIIAWSAADGVQAGHGRIGDPGTITSLAAVTLVGGQVIALAGDLDGDVRVWDLLANTPAGPPLRGHADVVVAVTTATADDGRTLVVSGSKDGHVRIRDLDAHLDPGLPAGHAPVDSDTGEQIASLTVATLANGRACVIAGTEDGMVRVLDLRDGTVAGQPWRACPGAVAAIAAGRLPDGRVTVFTGGEDSLVRAWDASTGQPACEPLPVPGTVLGMVFQPEPASLLTVGTGVAVACPRRSGM